MDKVLKFIRAETEGAAPFGRDLLEAFADELPPPPTFTLLSESAEGHEEQPPVDPEVIRQEILAEARAEAERLVQQAYKEGLARGTEAGREAFDATLAQCAQALSAAGDALQESHVAFLENLEPQVLSLVKEIVTRVIDVELRINPDVLRRSAERALALLADEHKVTLSLNPGDLEAIQAHKVELLDAFPRIESLTLQADPSVAPGGCVASTPATDVDAQIETRLAQVLDSLTE